MIEWRVDAATLSHTDFESSFKRVALRENKIAYDILTAATGVQDGRNQTFLRSLR